MKFREQSDLCKRMVAELQREVDEEVISLMVKAHEEALIKQQKNRDEAAKHLDGIEGLLDF